jgi:DNA invertase Pin-like site-specific DNA recombinase
MAEFVGDLISENTQEGLAAARARGRIGGRPSVMTAGKLRIARQMLDGGSTITEIAATIGVGRATFTGIWTARQRRPSQVCQSIDKVLLKKCRSPFGSNRLPGGGCPSDRMANRFFSVT